MRGCVALAIINPRSLQEKRKFTKWRPTGSCGYYYLPFIDNYFICTIMAMSHLYSKIAPKPVKRAQDNMSVSQTNAWMNGELMTIYKGVAPVNIDICDVLCCYVVNNCSYPNCIAFINTPLTYKIYITIK